MKTNNLCLLFLTIFISIILGYLFLPGLYEIHITPTEIINLKFNYQALTGLDGAPEDVVTYKNKIFLVSVRDTMTMWFQGINKAKDGGIYCFYPPFDKSSGSSQNLFEKIDKNLKNFEKIELEGFPQNLRFLPFGMKLINNTLYVINQEPTAERVDIFDIIESLNSQNSLHLSLHYHTSWILPNYFKGKTNNLAIATPNSFFITTYKPTDIDLINQISSHILFLKKTYVWFCEVGEKEKVNCSAVEDKRANSEFNNGMEIDQYGRLYVSQLVSKRIAVFQLDKNNINHQTLKFLKYIYVEGFPDNINYDPVNDELYIGCTSKLGEFFKVAAAITLKGSISDDFTLWGTIISIKNNEDANKLVSKIILRQNNMIRGISAVAKIDSFYLAGTIIENRILLIQEKK